MSGIRDFEEVPIPTDDEIVLELYPYLSDEQARLRLDCEQYPLQLSWRKGKYFCCWVDALTEQLAILLHSR